MPWSDVLLLAGIFFGSALPWLEAIVVIPIGIIAGLHPVLVTVIAILGNVATVAVAAWFGERLREWWIKRRRAQGKVVSEEQHSKGWGRVERIMTRWGLPALAILGPLGLGTQVSALVAVSLGVTARLSFIWVTAGTIAWSVVVAILTVAGLSFLGVGA